MGEIDEPGLGRRVMHLTHAAPLSADGNDVDDAAPTLFRHGGQRFLRNREGPAQIGLQHAVPIGIADLGNRFFIGDCGIVDHDIDGRAEMLLERLLWRGESIAVCECRWQPHRHREICVRARPLRPGARDSRRPRDNPVQAARAQWRCRCRGSHPLPRPIFLEPPCQPKEDSQLMSSRRWPPRSIGRRSSSGSISQWISTGRDASNLRRGLSPFHKAKRLRGCECRRLAQSPQNRDCICRPSRDAISSFGAGTARQC